MNDSVITTLFLGIWLFTNCGGSKSDHRSAGNIAGEEEDIAVTQNQLLQSSNDLPRDEEGTILRKRPVQLACDFGTRYMPGQHPHCDGGFRLPFFDEGHLGNFGSFAATFSLVYNSHLFYEYEKTVPASEEGEEPTIEVWAKLARYNDDEVEIGEGDFYGIGLWGALPKIVEVAEGKLALIHAGDKIVFEPLGNQEFASEIVTEYSKIKRSDRDFRWTIGGVPGYVEFNPRGLPVFEKRQTAQRSFDYDGMGRLSKITDQALSVDSQTPMGKPLLTHFSWEGTESQPLLKIKRTFDNNKAVEVTLRFEKERQNVGGNTYRHVTTLRSIWQQNPDQEQPEEISRFRWRRKNVLNFFSVRPQSANGFGPFKNYQIHWLFHCKDKHQCNEALFSGIVGKYQILYNGGRPVDWRQHRYRIIEQTLGSNPRLVLMHFEGTGQITRVKDHKVDDKYLLIQEYRFRGGPIRRRLIENVETHFDWERIPGTNQNGTRGDYRLTSYREGAAPALNYFYEAATQPYRYTHLAEANRTDEPFEIRNYNEQGSLASLKRGAVQMTFKPNGALAGMSKKTITRFERNNNQNAITVVDGSNQKTVSQFLATYNEKGQPINLSHNGWRKIIDQYGDDGMVENQQIFAPGSENAIFTNRIERTEGGINIVDSVPQFANGQVGPSNIKKRSYVLADGGAYQPVPREPFDDPLDPCGDVEVTVETSLKSNGEDLFSEIVTSALHRLYFSDHHIINKCALESIGSNNFMHLIASVTTPVNHSGMQDPPNFSGQGVFPIPEEQIDLFEEQENCPIVYQQHHLQTLHVHDETIVWGKHRGVLKDAVLVVPEVDYQGNYSQNGSLGNPFAVNQYFKHLDDQQETDPKETYPQFDFFPLDVNAIADYGPEPMNDRCNMDVGFDVRVPIPEDLKDCQIYLSIRTNTSNQSAAHVVRVSHFVTPCVRNVRPELRSYGRLCCSNGDVPRVVSKATFKAEGIRDEWAHTSVTKDSTTTEYRSHANFSVLNGTYEGEIVHRTPAGSGRAEESPPMSFQDAVEKIKENKGMYPLPASPLYFMADVMRNVTFTSGSSRTDKRNAAGGLFHILNSGYTLIQASPENLTPRELAEYFTYDYDVTPSTRKLRVPVLHCADFSGGFIKGSDGRGLWSEESSSLSSQTVRNGETSFEDFKVEVELEFEPFREVFPDWVY